MTTTAATKIYEAAAYLRAAGVNVEELVAHMQANEMPMTAWDFDREDNILREAATKIANFYYEEDEADYEEYETLWHFWYLVQYHPDEIQLTKDVEDIEAELTELGYLPNEDIEAVALEELDDETAAMAPLPREETGEAYGLAWDLMNRFAEQGRRVELEPVWAAYLLPLILEIRKDA